MQERANYWNSRVTRRRAIGGLAGAGLGATALAVVGCGGGGNQAKQPASSLVSTPVNTTRQAARGGVLPSWVISDTVSFEPFGAGTYTGLREAGFVYSRLLKYKTGTSQAKADGSVEPDAAESFELLPDATQVTFKIRPGLPFDSRSPTNGRPLDSQDVKFTWDRFSAIGRLRTDLVNSLNPLAPIESVTTPDAQTVVFKLAFPYAPILPTLAYSWYLFILPREADGGFDPKKDMRGSGAWMLTKYTASGGFEYRRNPAWYIKDQPFLDGLDRPIISEYATGLAEFKAGNISSYAVTQEDVIATKQEVPDLLLTQQSAFARSAGFVYFGLDSTAAGNGSPLLDDRVRLALSNLIDRDAWIDTFFNTPQFRDAGLPVETRWHSHVYAGWDEYWLDPNGSALGDGAKYFKHDPAEAKKLLNAAGFTSPIDLDYTFITTSEYGTQYPKQCEALRQMFESENDFRLQVNNPNFQQFVNGYNLSHGNFKGMALVPSQLFADIDGYLFSSFRDGGTYNMLKPGDPQLNNIIDRQRRETDRAKRVQIVQEFERYMATKFYAIPFPGQTLGFNMAWPWLGNFGAYNHWEDNSAPQEDATYLWLDTSKKKS